MRSAIVREGNSDVARILSITYDETLLKTREMILANAGHTVTSAFFIEEARLACQTPGYDLIIIGHSIPREDKLRFIASFRQANPKALVIALTRAGEPRLEQVDTYINPGDPEELVRAIARALNPPAQ